MTLGYPIVKDLLRKLFSELLNGHPEPQTTVVWRTSTAFENKHCFPVMISSVKIRSEFQQQELVQTLLISRAFRCSQLTLHEHLLNRSWLVRCAISANFVLRPFAAAKTIFGRLLLERVVVVLSTSGLFDD